jgi:hypothetical protein
MSFTGFAISGKNYMTTSGPQTLTGNITAETDTYTFMGAKPSEIAYVSGSKRKLQDQLDDLSSGAQTVQKLTLGSSTGLSGDTYLTVNIGGTLYNITAAQLANLINYLNKTGDTMTGTLNVSHSVIPTLTLNNPNTTPANVNMRLTNSASTNGSAVVVNSSNDFILANNDSNNIGFNINGFRKMTLLSTGNFGIGTSAPSTLLHVNGTGQFAQALTLGGGIIANGTTYSATTLQSTLDSVTNKLNAVAIGDKSLDGNFKTLKVMDTSVATTSDLSTYQQKPANIGFSTGLVYTMTPILSNGGPVTFTIANLTTGFNRVPLNDNYTFSGGIYSTFFATSFDVLAFQGTLTVTSSGYSNVVVTSKGSYVNSVTANGFTLTVNLNTYINSPGDSFFMTLTSATAYTMSVIGSEICYGTLGVTGATTLSSTLGVSGNTTIGGTLGVSGNTTIGGTLGVTGATTVSNTLNVTDNNVINIGSNVVGKESNAGKIGYGTFTSNTLDIIGAGTAALSRNIKLWDNVAIPGTLSVVGAQTNTGSITANGGLTVPSGQTLTCNGTLSFGSSGLTSSGAITANGGIKPSSNFVPPDTTYLGSLTKTTLSANASLTSGTVSYPVGKTYFPNKGTYIAHGHVFVTAGATAVNITSGILFFSGDSGTGTQHNTDGIGNVGGEYCIGNTILSANNGMSLSVMRIVQVTSVTGQYFELGLNITFTMGSLTLMTDKGAGIAVVRIA